MRWGIPATRRLYLALQGGACGAFVLAAALGLIPLWSGLFPLALLPAAWRAAREVREPAERAGLTRAIQTTLGIHMAGSVLLLSSVLSAAFLR